MYGVHKYGHDWDHMPAEYAYRGHSCTLAGVEHGKLFQDKTSSEAQDYLRKLRKVNPGVGFEFVKIKEP